MKRTLGELLRYLLTGGIATLVDWAVLYVAGEWLLVPLGTAGLYLAHALSFSAGLLVNYLLSNVFVFTAEHQKGKGNGLKAFLLFAAIGLVGLGLTELGAWAADALFGADTVLLTVGRFPIRVYLVAKVVLTVIVLAWNYLARKLLIYDRKEPEHA